jgi:hypothetical protein
MLLLAETAPSLQPAASGGSGEEMEGTMECTGGLRRRPGSAREATVVTQVVAEAALPEGFEGGIGQLHPLPSPLTFGVPQTWAAGWRALPARTQPADEPTQG